MTYTFIPNLHDQLAQVPERSILSRSLLKNPETDVTLFQFAKGQELNEHTAAYSAMLHFLQGDGTLRLGGEEMPYQAGSWAFMPANLSHAIRADSDTVMMLILWRG